MYEFILKKTFCDAPEPWQVSFQEAATPTMEGIINLHNDIITIGGKFRISQQV